MTRFVPVLSLIGTMLLAALPAAVAAETYRIEPDGSGDFATIQAAVEAAETHDIIELATGTFTGSGNRDVNLLGKSITIRSESGDPQSCVIDCQGSSEAFHRAFLVVSGEGPDCVLEGFTITGGYVSDMGGAIDCWNGAATLRNLVFTGNRSEWNGGALSGGSPTVMNCVFTGNIAASHGGGLACSYPGSVSCTGCVFRANAAAYHGGAVRVSDPAIVTLTGCTFSGNESDGLGSAIATSSTSACQIVNSTFVGNQDGNVIFAWSYPVELDHTLIAFNLNVGAINADAVATLVCCDLYGNGADWSGPIAEQLGVNGNISADPQFCSEAPHEHGNWGLQSDSPCIEPQSGCGLIGAWGVGCDEVPVLRLTWGALKAAFRE